MTELINFLLSLLLFFILAFLVWESTKIVDEKVKRRKR
jgi:hypothetical protein